MSPECRILAGIAATLEVDYLQTDVSWAGSPFEWIRSRTSRQKGAIGEKLMAGWLAARGFNVTRATSCDADRVIEGKNVEIKFSALWESGTYTFQQLRDQEYDLVICLGVSPFDAHCWVISKEDILHHWRVASDFSSQHGGASGSDTAWITVNPVAVPDWLSGYGGTLTDGLARLSELTGYRPTVEDVDDSTP